MAKFRTCEYCGEHLDYGERCSCQPNNMPDVPADTNKNPVLAANEAAIQEGIAADVMIHLEKKAGEDMFLRKIEASSASAALNGLAVLIAEYAKLTEVPVLRVLSILAATMSAPAIREERGQEGA